MNALDIALNYITRGWSPVPIPRGKKGPVINEWQKLRITTETAPHYFADRRANVGVLLGEPSGGLVDVDLDEPEVSIAWHYFAPPTEAVFGRESAPNTHFLYICPEIPHTLQFMDPTRRRVTLAEVRSGGGQTVFPGSIHPSREQIEWSDAGEPAAVGARQLMTAVMTSCAAAMIARQWPEQGGRHDGALTVAAVLTRAGWTEGAVARFLVAVIAAVSNSAQEARNPSVWERTARDCLERLKTDRTVRGWPAFHNLFGAAVAGQVDEWLALDTSRFSTQAGSPPPPPPGTSGQSLRSLADLGLPIDKIIKRGRERGSFELHLAEDRVVDLGPTGDLLSFVKVRAAVLDAVPGHVLGNVIKKA
jgi:Bifunctional DNA primase/polymerase, N-terminal